MSKKLLANVGNTVVDNYRRYYQEYEGTFITATDKSEDDTLDTSRYIEVTEIWGNTVQDENNLEDIQSVGELYVDDEGNPILDELGREQYKIEIESCNKNLLKDTLVFTKNKSLLTGGQGEIVDWINDHTTLDFMNWNNPTNIQIVFSTSLNSYSKIAFYDIQKNFLVQYVGNEYATGLVPSGTCFYRVTISSNTVISDNVEIQINVNNTPSIFTSHQSHKTTILLPCQLQKVGDVYDRLYWDNEKRKYVVEKKIKTFSIYNLTITKTPTIGNNNARIDLLVKPDIGISNTVDGRMGTILAKNLKEISYYVQDRDSIDCQYSFNNNAGGYWFGIVLPKDFNTNKLFIDELKRLDVEFYMQLVNSELIETNITEKILLSCYSEKTHIFVNSTVDASMKVLMPYKEII